MRNIRQHYKNRASLPNYRVFEVKFYGPTDTRGSRIKITDHRFEKSRFFSYRHDVSGSIDNGYLRLYELGINVVGQGEGDKSYFLFSDDFETQLDGDKVLQAVSS